MAARHHLRFVQPMALDMKVSDEFTVPLYREHQRQPHQVGNELAWWHNLNIKPLPIAKTLWIIIIQQFMAATATRSPNIRCNRLQSNSEKSWPQKTAATPLKVRSALHATALKSIELPSDKKASHGDCNELQRK
jgi:hypothetical protein